MPSTVALLPVLTALVAKLAADTTLAALVAPAPTAFGGRGIYNVVPQGAVRPYLVIDGGTETPFNTLGTLAMLKWGGDVTVQIKAVSNQQSDSEGLAILARAKFVVDQQPLTVAGFATAIVQWESTQPSYVELVAGSPVRHFPAILRVQVHES